MPARIAIRRSPRTSLLGPPVYRLGGTLRHTPLPRSSHATTRFYAAHPLTPDLPTQLDIRHTFLSVESDDTQQLLFFSRMPCRFKTVWEGLSFVTVHGAGHMVPMTRPLFGLHVLQNFLAGEW